MRNGIIRIELALVVPDRDCDELDAVAWRIVCPVCGARRGSPCLWALTAAAPSWRTHEGRRALTWAARARPRVKP
jgi:hypothetical protein